MPKKIVETPLTGRTKDGDILTEKEELFCQLYVMNFNRIDAVIEAYDIDRSKQHWRSTASSIAGENLLKPALNRRIRELLTEYHLNDEAVDSEMAFVIQQNANLPAKNKAIEIYNKLGNRYEEHNKVKFGDTDREGLEKLLAERLSRAIGNNRGAGQEE